MSNSGTDPPGIARGVTPLPIVPVQQGQYSGIIRLSRRKDRPVQDNDAHSLSYQDCLVALMVAVSASDETIRTSELVEIQSSVNLLPVFAKYDIDRMNHVSQMVFDLFEQEDGLDALFGLIRDNLPEELFETAYALACDVAASDGVLTDQELRMLEEIRYELRIDRLIGAAIERGARARHYLYRP
ncbi:MAG: 2-dehydro-3-deoxyphosphooctonate aldolase [Pseudooceanicola sp.]|jgi:tellurite resistance protein|nr:2-dehydro-3-deoxyphosphooctonate aldolase [Pseudooceanicola sp.]|tara:strand:+ start:1309 stop:1863 length:555 start_codon:yes stop_codon:yes gene_type:complete